MAQYLTSICDALGLILRAAKRKNKNQQNKSKLQSTVVNWKADIAHFSIICVIWKTKNVMKVKVRLYD